MILSTVCVTLCYGKCNEGDKQRSRFITREGSRGWKLPDKENVKTTPEQKMRKMQFRIINLSGLSR